ncbi:MAG: hypothetical protein RIR11_2279, partial [Bacteroidota bacterium]
SGSENNTYCFLVPINNKARYIGLLKNQTDETTHQKHRLVVQE